MEKENQISDVPRQFYEESENKGTQNSNTPVRFGQVQDNNIKLVNEKNSPLMNHSTPSPKSKKKFFNPFEAGLRKCLHLSVLSPSVFSKVISPSQDPTFWRIEDVSLIKPAAIEENPIEQFEHLEAENDSAVQEAIMSYFQSSQIVPSPCDTLPKNNLIQIEDNFEADDFNDSLIKDFKNASSQTELSLPPVLPPELEKALKPYFTFTQDQQESEEGNFNNSSLRRKLLFNHPNENKMSISFQDQETTPLKSGRIFTPNFREMIFRGQVSGRSFGTPLPGAAFSPPSTSPIVEDKMQVSISCNSSFVRTLNFDNPLESDEDKEDMSFLVPNEPVEDESTNATAMVSGEAPSGRGHNIATFLSSQLDSGYSTVNSLQASSYTHQMSIANGHIESSDTTWTNIISSTPSK